mmetsp:Transcript_5203/g.13589  ORF Transcript_5203/g.13589 Transcript_5203/m.13589 type:complete len:381 (+) Transcript_5203:283-1425(+)
MRLRSGTWLQEKEMLSTIGQNATIIRCVLENIEAPRDLAACMMVSKSWRKIAQELYLWEGLSDKHYPNVTELMRTTMEKKFMTPIPRSEFRVTSMVDQECMRKLLINRLLLLDKQSDDCAKKVSEATLTFPDLVFTLDILVDGHVKSSTCFERPHANYVNTILVNLPIGNVPHDWATIAQQETSSITGRGIRLLGLVENKIEVKVSLMRRTDLKMTQIFSYDTATNNRFNWDLSWDTAQEDWTSDVNDIKDEWTLWLYSSHGCCTDCGRGVEKNTFKVTNPPLIFEDVDFPRSPRAIEVDEGSRWLYHSDSEGQSGRHFVLCDLKLHLSLVKSADGLQVKIDNVRLMEFFHFWNSLENTFYVELTDREFLACLENERGWY